MASLRQRLGVLAATWLVFQLSWLAALVPRDCCAAHRPAELSCHESAESSPGCQLTGACDGPLSAFFTLLSNHGILPEPASTVPFWTGRRVALAVDVNAIGRFETPESPPPRA